GLSTLSLLNVFVAHSGCLERIINHYVHQENLGQKCEELKISLALQAIYLDILQGEQ
ncbi:nucleoside phosphorylase, partial [Salmonella enterica subsp. enterica serovar Kentucky]